MEVLHQNLTLDLTPFAIDGPNYVVIDYHIELLQMETVLGLVNLSISDYSCTFYDSYSLLKSYVDD
jgi:hypothetical protein